LNQIKRPINCSLKSSISLILLGIFLSILPAFAQSTTLSLQNPRAYHILDRLELQSGALLPSIHTSVKAYDASMVAKVVDSLRNESFFYSSLDRKDHFYLLKDIWEWSPSSKIKSNKPFLKYFYKTKTDFFALDTTDFMVRINPIIHFEVMSELDNERFLFQNTRGIEVKGRISEKVGFYSMLTENQGRFQNDVSDYILTGEYPALPNGNRFKPFASGDDFGGIDWFLARGYISFSPVKNIDIYFGHDQHFIGNGRRSLLLSDFSGPVPFIKIKTNVWKLQYTNLFAQLTNQFNNNDFFPEGFADGLRGKKFMALHHLSYNVNSKLNIGLFESVIFGRSNSVELSYFNPVIFYRAVENDLGSPDNVNIGLDFKWLLAKNISVYGQLLIDEWNFAALQAQEGDWKNKQAFQLGAKVINVAGIDHLDVQVEYSQVRPYTYTHYDTIANFTHFNNPLAHPLGANFRELLGIIKYQTRKDLFFQLQAAYYQKGLDSEDTNWGGNIFLDYRTLEQELNNSIGQGIQNDVFVAQFLTSWQFHHHLFIDAFYRFRSSNNEVISNESHSMGLGFRMNIGRRELLF